MSLSQVYPTPTKAASIPFVPTGVYRARVVNVRGSLVDIEIPRLTGDLLHTNIEVIGAPNTPMLAPRDLCYVAFVEGYPDSLVVLGNVRLPSTAGPSYVAPGTVPDPLEEYTASRSGVFDAINGFYQPIRQATIFTQLVATLRTEGSTGTLVSVYIGSTVVASVYIPPHAATAFADIYVSALENELINFTVDYRGDGAETLFIALRGNLVDPLDALDPIDEYAFGLGGSLTTGFGLQYPAKRETILYEIFATLGVVGSSDTVLKVWAHDAEEDWADYVLGEVTISAGSPFSILSIAQPVDKWTQISVEVTSVGTAAENLGVFVRGRRGS